MPVNVCVPVLKRYDLLERLLRSLHVSTIQPRRIYIINNGRDIFKLSEVLDNSTVWSTDVQTPSKPMGVAESWNWFITHVPEERLIVNDDVTFGPHSLERLAAIEGELVTGLRGHAFSCFLIRDTLVEKIGSFDEALSPGYAYFEDCDYAERMRLKDIPITHCDDSEVVHDKSGTFRAYDEAEMREHHRRYRIAQDNYVKKWGAPPEGVKLVKELIK